MSHLRPLLAACLSACFSQVKSSDAVDHASERPVDREQIRHSKSACGGVPRKPGSIMVWLGKRTPRCFAEIMLLVVSFLEICGCNPARTCDQLRATRLSAMPLETLSDQCARCLSQQEMAALRHIRKGTAGAEESAILHDMTVQESLSELHGSSFGTYNDGSDLEVNPRVFTESGAGSLQQAKPIAWPIPESVLFLYAESPTSQSPETQGALRRTATGFILRVPERRGETSQYLVTARHVVDPEWALCGKKNPQSITVRLNRWDGGVAYESIPLNRNKERQFITADDEETDLALIPINAETIPNFDRYKLVAAEFDNLPTADELRGLQHDPRIVTVGVSAPKLIGLVDSPISEPGVIASDVSGSPMGVRCTVESPIKAFRMWLVDTSVERGLSGAPVYTALARGPSRSTTPVLLGIQAVVWPDKGRAGVTPVFALRDLVQIARARSQVAMDFRKGHPD